MEIEQIVIMSVMLVITNGMSYLVGDLRGYMRCLRKEEYK